MEGIGKFFDRFKNKALVQVGNLTTVLEILKKHTGVNFSVSDVVISKGTLTIKASPAFKNEVYIKKQAILKDLAQKIQGTVISDIK